MKTLIHYFGKILFARRQSGLTSFGAGGRHCHAHRVLVWRAAFFIASLAVLFPYSMAAQGLFTPVTGAGSGTVFSASAVNRSQAVNVDFNALRALNEGIANAIRLNMFTNAVFDGVVSRKDQRVRIFPWRSTSDSRATSRS